MKTIAAVLLLVACAQAINVRNLKPLRVFPSKINPTYTGAYWDHIKSSQVIKPEVYPGFKKGLKPQPAYAGISLKNHINSRITGGEQATHGQFPWQALISMDNSYVCGGSLISDTWVLTAGHCGYQFSTFVIILGAQDAFDNSEDGRQVFQTRDVTVHEDYDPDTINNDISLLRLPKSAQVTQYVNIIALPPRSMQGDDLVGQKLTVSGWGKQSDSASGIGEFLNYVTMPVMTNEECSNTFGDVITPSKICTDTTGGHSSCNGDSGGPLILQGSDGRYVEVGIVSFGASAGCEKGYPDAFTRVTSFLDWIETNSGISVRDYKQFLSIPCSNLDRLCNYFFLLIQNYILSQEIVRLQFTSVTQAVIMKTAIVLVLLISLSQGLKLRKHESDPQPRQGLQKLEILEEPASKESSDEKPEPYITGGEVATRGQFPWAVFIQIDNSYICAGALISDEWVLTAAECTYGFAMFQIYIGAQNWQDDEVDRIIATTTNRIAHGDFDPNTFKNDIALIKLTHRVGFNQYIQPVALPTHSMADVDFTGYNATALGWGVTSDNDTAINTDLRYAPLTVISESECQYSWGDNIGLSNLCTNALDGKSTCSGDNGGPLVSDDNILIGVQSFVNSNGCQLGVASVFTKVTHYLDWIEANSDIKIGQ
ncbi:transmembrane protease serine 9-like [Ischnura elegans]|uniref:transmembrane protease serine 9-like n=1 Tax=Ischnura elegans TaxID=197161 RepID=UPI001ED8B720|nr:transmembrane protease serine 9-like [Ischnura elegans]